VLPHTRLPAAPIRASLTRFAPAPTGYLHLGHVLNACYVWNTARRFACRVLLRIEDHDRERCRPKYEAAILEDLDWLGFHADIFPAACYRMGRCDGRQSDRDAVYREAVEMLRREGRVYGCECSRRALGGGPAGIERPYPGTCRDRGLPVVDGYGWRVRLDDSVEVFEDALLGPQQQQPSAQCGDLLVRDRLGNWTYQFAVTVDDDRQAIDLVVRGEDLLASTGRQIALARLLGRRRPPVFMHHPLVMKSPHQKLSKSDGATGIRDLRAAGWTPERVFAEVERLQR
jgi:glutamyl-tRNA synthetase/glutamyl-Q tRNA(Asp) synthetase